MWIQTLRLFTVVVVAKPVALGNNVLLVYAWTPVLMPLPTFALEGAAIPLHHPVIAADAVVLVRLVNPAKQAHVHVLKVSVCVAVFVCFLAKIRPTVGLAETHVWLVKSVTRVFVHNRAKLLVFCVEAIASTHKRMLETVAHAEPRALLGKFVRRGRAVALLRPLSAVGRV